MTDTTFTRAMMRGLCLAAAAVAMASAAVAQSTPTQPQTPSVEVTVPSLTTPTLAPPASPTLETATPIAAPDTAPTLPSQSDTLLGTAQDASDRARAFLQDGGPSIWAIAALAVATLALILWKAWRLMLIGAWTKGKARRALIAYEKGDFACAAQIVRRRRGVRSKVVGAAIVAVDTLPDATAREETARVAKQQLAQARSGLGALELIATIAPLLGLLGTVLGMIAAFQALQSAGAKADPSMLAGGIWEALLTTAAGMAVAIPASAALTWFEAVKIGRAHV